MATQDTPPKVQGLIFVGAVAIILLVRGFTDLDSHDFRGALICLGLGVGLTLVFYRRRMLAFVLTGLALIFVTVGVDAIFHPTAIRFVIASGAFAAGCLIAVWDAKRHPGQNPNDSTAIFDHKRK